MNYIKQTQQETERIAKEYAKKLKVGDILLLHGELGSGKTFFTNKLCGELDVNTIVNSPSYVLLNEYEGKFNIYHYDLYRLTTSEEAIELGILDRLKDGITIIEWPELIMDYIDDKCVNIYFSHNGEFRDINIVEDNNNHSR